mmetsp:Transcript_8811/g.54174  ORF Transcript_8811/g.54174 Transcript_8811/m.54174 type:complete len:81 (-) Transcript_8811:7980-8222(-)
MPPTTSKSSACAAAHGIKGNSKAHPSKQQLDGFSTNLPLAHQGLQLFALLMQKHQQCPVLLCGGYYMLNRICSDDMNTKT